MKTVFAAEIRLAVGFLDEDDGVKYSEWEGEVGLNGMTLDLGVHPRCCSACSCCIPRLETSNLPLGWMTEVGGGRGSFSSGGRAAVVGGQPPSRWPQPFHCYRHLLSNLQRNDS